MREDKAPIKILVAFVLILSILAVDVSAQYKGDIAPDFTLTDVEGKVFKLSDYRGTVVVLEFFGVDCYYCKVEVGELRVVQERFGDSVAIISVSKDGLEDTKAFVEKYGMTWRVAYNGWGVFLSYGFQGVPMLVIIDQDGYIRYRHVGFTEESTLSKVVKELLKKPPVASFTYSPTNPVVGETVTFNASASHDPDGTILSYEWDFGDGATGTGVTTTHAYATAATYTIILTVTDNDNAFANTTVKVTVSPSIVPVHDVAITSVTALEITVTVGGSVSITVVAKNEGTETETFDVIIYYDTTTIETRTVTNLSPGASKTLTSNWDTAKVSPGTYTIKVVASTIPKEKDTADNTFVDGKVTVQEAPPPPPPPASGNFLYAAAGTAIIIVAAIVVYTLKKEASQSLGKQKLSLKIQRLSGAQVKTPQQPYGSAKNYPTEYLAYL